MSAATAMTGSLERFMTQGMEAIDRELQVIAREVRDEVAPQLTEAVEYALLTRGKRLRPILCIAAYRAVGGEERPGLLRVAAALEIVHTYSLVHDDLPCMDNDELRRGRPTVHRVYGAPVATLAGAALLPLAVRVLVQGAEMLGLRRARVAELVAELCRAAGAAGMVGGQLCDLEAERAPIDAATLESIHRAKTGALLTASLRLGGLAGGASAEALAAFTAYGEAVGLAFQVADDILDVVGDADALGKAAGRDQHMNKASYPVLFGLEGAREFARGKANEAKAAIQAVQTPELLALADYVVEREK